MSLRTLAAGTLFLALLCTGCDSNNTDQIFEPIVIPPPSDIADSLYIETESGLKYFDLKEGIGATADDGYIVEFHWILWLSDSTLVQSTYLTGFPQQSIMGNGSLSEGWNEGLKGMKSGGYRQIVLSPEIGYGADGNPAIGIPPNSTVILEFALTGVGIQTQ